MKKRTAHLGFTAVLALALTLSAWPGPAPAAGPDLNICSLVSDADLAKLYRKKLHPTPGSGGCFWSKKPGGMAYLDISLHEHHKPLRQYFQAKLPGHVKLEEVQDLGDQGLMTVTEGALGLVVIRKGDWVLQSTVLFLDIAPGSGKQAVLWDIYRRILARL